MPHIYKLPDSVKSWIGEGRRCLWIKGFDPTRPDKGLAFLPSSIPGSERRKEAAGRVREFLESGCPSPHADDLIQSSQTTLV